ncbi:MAG: SPFH domain-containing protein [Lachnospiraceae bacterium]|jgi:membrane protease subunit (stomatin/prohibitin family)|nr:SPFH domain-containing protein [Lachnospiraceae bacterium]
MGLISAGLGAIGGVLADQWKEYFYCEAMDKDVLMTKGVKHTSGRSTNTKGSDNIITNGSGIAVADGQAMIIVDDGKVVEFCAEPGRFTWDASSEPSIFTGNLWQSIKDTFKVLGKRFAYGGDTGHDQRIYYFNTKELIDNKFGTQNPIPFRIVDQRANVDLELSVRCAGVYSYRIADPILFYAKVMGNVRSEYRREEIDLQLKSEFISALQPAFAKLSAMQLRPSEIIAHNTELEQAMNEVLSQKWGELRGLEVVSVALSTVTMPEEDQERLKMLQTAATLSNPNLGAGYMTASLGSALNTAAANENGAMAGLMGVGMGMNMGGGQIANMYAAGQQYNQQYAQYQQPQYQQQAQQPAANAWTCPVCGNQNNGNFCPQCGAKKPEVKPGWICPNCGTANTTNFCAQCGTKRPE